MRHAVFGRKLGRDINARRALLNNLANNLLISGQVTTTFAKAKFAQSYVEKLVSGAKSKNLYRRRALATILTRHAFQKLTEEISPGFKNRTGGYTRITKLMMRRGDAAKMARLELLEWEKIEKPKEAKVKKLKSAKPKIVRKSTALPKSKPVKSNKK